MKLHWRFQDHPTSDAGSGLIQFHRLPGIAEKHTIFSVTVRCRFRKSRLARMELRKQPARKHRDIATAVIQTAARALSRYGMETRKDSCMCRHLPPPSQAKWPVFSTCAPPCTVAAANSASPPVAPVVPP